MPVILTAVESKGFSGNITPQLLDLFPDQTPIKRSSMSSWDRKELVAAVKKTGRKNSEVKRRFILYGKTICCAKISFCGNRPHDRISQVYELATNPSFATRKSCVANRALKARGIPNRPPAGLPRGRPR